MQGLWLAVCLVSPSALEASPGNKAALATQPESSRWEPFRTVQRPAVPANTARGKSWGRNPLDEFIAAEHDARGLQPRPEAARGVLLRRVYLDLIGLSPTPGEQRAFLEDAAPDAYEKVVNRLLSDPRYGERWGRHWMDVWRYSDWAGWADGGQVRDSKPHIWRWRDWIVESLNQDKGYDRMIVEMLAADEMAPEDPGALRATGFLARNYKMLSREQWLEDTLKHTSQAFLGVTMGCAKCHDHMFDPISQKEYYELRAVFEPHQVRTDRVPGQTNTVLDGLVRVFDVENNPPTYLFRRGDERKPDTNRVMQPGVPRIFGGRLQVTPVDLPLMAAQPDRREFVRRDISVASERTMAEARAALEKLTSDKAATPAKLKDQERQVALVEAKHAALLAVLRVERIEDEGRKASEEWKQAATEANLRQRQATAAEARWKCQLAERAVALAEAKTKVAVQATNAVGAAGVAVSEKEATAALAKAKAVVEQAIKERDEAKKKSAEAVKALAASEQEAQAAPSAAYQPRPVESYPANSSGRRLALARWIAAPENPLTARVAMNHIWMRHFGHGLVSTPADFGRNGRPPVQPQLLDWLASELMARGWSMKAMHRLIVFSSTYRMAATPDEANARIDPDNLYWWRMPSHRMEAEAVRDNLLYIPGNLDPAMGGPDIDHKLGLTSKRRSVYLRIAAEKEVEFLKIFDSPSVTECYERRPSVMPQQALALANSELALAQARFLAGRISAEAGENAERFITLAFRNVLARPPTREEQTACREFLDGNGHAPATEPPPPLIQASLSSRGAMPAAGVARLREHLMLVLFNHNDFVTVR